MSNGSDDGITYGDADFYNAIFTGNINFLKKNYSEADFQFPRTPRNNNILHLAAQFGQRDCVSWIHELPISSSLLQEPNLKGEIPLHLAGRGGHLEVVKALIAAAKKASPHNEMESGVEPDKNMVRKKSKEGETALHEAVRYHHSEVVNTLIDADPELVHVANNKAYTPLYMAVERGYVDLVKMIKEKKGTTSPSHTSIMGRTTLHAAVLRGDQGMTETLLEWEPNLIKQVDEQGRSPLHFAVYLGNASIVKKLLEKSPDKSVIYFASKDSKETALHVAAFRGNKEIVKLLLSYCPDCCEQVDGNGRNVLHFAAMSHANWFVREIVKEENLLRVGGVVNEKDDGGNTPLHLHASQNYYNKFFSKESIVDKLALNNDNLSPIDLLSKSNMTRSREYAKKLKEKEKFVGPLSWQDAIESSEDGKANEDSKANEEKTISDKRRAGEIHLIVAALIATVTFAAGFTLPGGYKGDDGMAVLSKNAAFKAFVVTDTIAVMLSLSAVFVYFFMSLHHRDDMLLKHLTYGFFLTVGGMVAMVIAFITGLYAVLPFSSGLPIVTCIICCFFLVAFCFEFRQSSKNV